MILEKLKNEFIRHAISFPFIWMMFFPVVLLDLFLEIYHRVCFPLYGLEIIERSRYVKLDRHKLSKLSPLEKVFCSYCGYANGVLNYSVKIAGETVKYWCGIKHEKDSNFKSPKHHKQFLEYEKLK